MQVLQFEHRHKQINLGKEPPQHEHVIGLVEVEKLSSEMIVYQRIVAEPIRIP